MNVDALKSLPTAVLLGGTSAEREVSLQSGAAVAAALEALGADVQRIDTADAHWWRQLTDSKLVFIALHGPGGEDGVVQGLLEALSLPYTGSGVTASALAMDKVICKRLWRDMGLPTPEFAELHADTDWSALIDALGAVFVKPVTGGSSVGTRAVDNASTLQSAWQDASQYGAVIAERLITGPEYTVAVLGDSALPAICVETDNAFYDYHAKYLSDSTRYLCPCGLSPEEESEIAQLAVDAFKALGCEAWGRVDFMRDQDGRFQLLEVNTVPGMTSHSLVPMAASAAGLDFNTLVARLCCMALEGEQ